jgi:hypothetical protein
MPSWLPLSKLELEKSRVYFVYQHRETGVYPHHRLRTSETNSAHTGYTTNDIDDRVTIQEIGEPKKKGAKAPFGPCNNAWKMQGITLVVLPINQLTTLR